MCSQDTIPIKLLKEVFDTVRPSFLLIINSSFSNGNFPSIFRYAVVQPLLKKLNFDDDYFV